MSTYDRIPTQEGRYFLLKTSNYIFNYKPEFYKILLDTIFLSEKKQEKKILELLVKGKTCAEIANEVGYCERTIQSRRKELYERIAKETNIKLNKNCILKKKIFSVYLLKFPNNKIYIGQSKDTVNRWKNNGINYKSNEQMYNDIQKYGWNNIIKTIVYDNLTYEESITKEKELILQYKSNLPEYGYNKTN